MTKETIGSTRKEEQKIRRDRTVDDSTIESMKGYFGVEDHATLVRYAKDVSVKSRSSLSDS